MVAEPHRLTRSLVIGNHKYRLVVEVSKPSRIIEGMVFDNGVKVRKIVSVAGDTETSMKRTLLDVAYNRVGLEFDDSSGLGDWEYEKLSLGGTATA